MLGVCLDQGLDYIDAYRLEGDRYYWHGLQVGALPGRPYHGAAGTPCRFCNTAEPVFLCPSSKSVGGSCLAFFPSLDDPLEMDHG